MEGWHNRVATGQEMGGSSMGGGHLVTVAHAESKSISHT